MMHDAYNVKKIITDLQNHMRSVTLKKGHDSHKYLRHYNDEIL